VNLAPPRSLLALLCLTLALPAAAEPARPVEIDPGVRVLPTCGLTAVAFRTALDGHATDTCGAIYQTADGGKGWTRDRATEAKLYGSPEPDDRPDGRVHYLHWWSPAEGLAGFVDGAAFLTSDGGATWRKVQTPLRGGLSAAAASGDSILFCDHEGHVHRADRRGQQWARVDAPSHYEGPCTALEATKDGTIVVTSARGTTWTASSPGATRTRVVPAAATAASRRSTDAPGCPGIRGDEVVHCLGNRLVFERPGAPERSSPLLTPATGKRHPLLAAEHAGDRGWWGYTERQMARSDDGQSWVVVSELPARPARVTYLPSGFVVLEAVDGSVFRGDRGGESWLASPAPAFDRADVEQLRTGAAAAEPAFACVARTPGAWLEVTYTDNGCYHHRPDQKVFRLEVRDDGGHVRFSEPVAAREADLGREAVSRLVQQLAGAVQPLERGGRCGSTSSRQVKVQWRCGFFVAGELPFVRDVCGDDEETSAQTAGYSRALEIERVLLRAREQAGR
jgi:photosystem II stability/assembly factor-like uncharacterized protein